MYDKISPNSTAAWARASTARFCPKRDTDFADACVWYSIPSIPGFDVCTYCYNTHIAPTPFAKDIVAQNDRPEVEKTCDFHFPYTTGMWYHAVRTNNTEPFLQHVKTVACLDKCRGVEGSTPRPGLQWMTLVANRIGSPEAIGGLAICRRCYESIVCGTPFAGCFEPLFKAQGPQETWTCDLALPSIEDVFTHAARGAGVGWGDVLNTMRARLAVQPCAGPSGSLEPRHMWTLRTSNEDFAVCDQHYHDDVIPSGFSHEFTPLLRQQRPGEVFICDLTALNLKLALSLTSSLKTDFQHFRDAVAVTLRTPRCNASGVVDGDFYRLVGPNGPVDNVDICAACYFSYMRPIGFNQFFVRQNLPRGTGRLCDMAVGVPRATVCLWKLLKSAITGDFNFFAEHIIAHAQIPQCPTTSAVVDNRKWYGTDEILICEECHYDVVRPSSFPYPIPARRPRVDERCSLWASEVRALWGAACVTGDLSAVAAKARECQASFARVDDLDWIKAHNEHIRASISAIQLI